MTEKWNNRQLRRFQSPIPPVCVHELLVLSVATFPSYRVHLLLCNDEPDPSASSHASLLQPRTSGASLKMADSPFEQRTPVQTHENNQIQDIINQTQEDDQVQDAVQTHDSDDNRSESSEESDCAEICVASGTDMPPPPPIDKKKWPMDDMKKPPIDAGIAIPPPPSPVDVESQQSFPREPPYWRRLIKNKTFQMIAAALLAVTIGLVVAATVEKVPDEAKAFLALPGYMWLRAVKAAGTFKSHVLTTMMN